MDNNLVVVFQGDGIVVVDNKEDIIINNYYLEILYYSIWLKDCENFLEVSITFTEVIYEVNEIKVNLDNKVINLVIMEHFDCKVNKKD